jgi:hypothetical protein
MISSMKASSEAEGCPSRSRGTPINRRIAGVYRMAVQKRKSDLKKARCTAKTGAGGIL